MPFDLLTPPLSSRPSPQHEKDDWFFPEFPIYDHESSYNRRESNSSGDECSPETSPTESTTVLNVGSSDVRKSSFEGLKSRRSSFQRDGGNQDGLHTPPASPPATSLPSPISRPAPLPSRPSVNRAQSVQSSVKSTSAPTFNSARATRPRGLTPLTPLTPCIPPHHPAGMAKSQSLSRALFARMDTPGGGLGKGKGKQQKIIVPTKAFKTSFTLDMSSSELARR